jgi:hypothetical protein
VAIKPSIAKLALTRLRLLTVCLLVTLLCAGCPLFGIYGAYLYSETIIARLPRESVDSAHYAFLAAAGFTGYSIEWTRLTCMNYIKRGAWVTECWDPIANSTEEWVYQVDISISSFGRRYWEQNRAIVKSLAAQIKEDVEAAVPGATVTIQTRESPSPM